jgi:hypothetical protein
MPMKKMFFKKGKDMVKLLPIDGPLADSVVIVGC